MKIAKLYINTESREKVAFVDSDGPYKKVTLVGEDGTKYYSQRLRDGDPILALKAGDDPELETWVDRGGYSNFKLVVGGQQSFKTAPSRPATQKEEVRVVSDKTEFSDALLGELAREVIGKAVKSIESELEVIRDMLTNPIQ